MREKTTATSGIRSRRRSSRRTHWPRITGYNQGEIYLLSVIAAIVNGNLPDRRDVRSGGRAVGGGAVGSGLLRTDERQSLPNTEVFINAAVVWAIALILQERFVAAGALLALWRGCTSR